MSPFFGTFEEQQNQAFLVNYFVHISTWVFYFKFAAYFQKIFLQDIFEGVLLLLLFVLQENIRQWC